MGQQQLLLIVLGVIIVGIAIAVGISMFKSNAQSSNRDQVINDLNNLAAKAQQYYRKPTSMAGGGQSFNGFALSPSDLGNANGGYGVRTGWPTSAGGSADTTQQAITGSPVAIYIVGIGTEKGNNTSLPVEACIKVTADADSAGVVN